jgi:hypothetical protein
MPSLIIVIAIHLNKNVDVSKSITPQSVPICIQLCPVGNSGQPERN